MLKPIVSAPDAVFAAVIAPRRLQSFGEGVQAERLASEVVSTVNVAAYAGRCCVTPKKTRRVRAVAAIRDDLCCIGFPPGLSLVHAPWTGVRCKGSAQDRSASMVATRRPP